MAYELCLFSCASGMEKCFENCVVLTKEPLGFKRTDNGMAHFYKMFDP